MRLYQIDVKSIFFNGDIKEDIYVEQPNGFEGTIFPKHVFQLNNFVWYKVSP